MSLLGKFLKAKDPLFTLAIKQLEDITGKTGVDTALIGEILHKAYKKAAEMGLAADFNGKELYYSLINRLKKDESAMLAALKLDNPNDLEATLPAVLAAMAAQNLPMSGWFMKASVAKRMLKANPPTNAMKRLGYAKVEDMLARESIYEVYGALRFAEPPQWLNVFLKQYEALTFKDFEHRQIEIVQYQPSKWGDLADHFVNKKLHNITHLKELGVICVMPLGKLRGTPGLALLMTAFMAHYIYEIRLYSSFFKLISVRTDFGARLVDTLIADTAHITLNAKHKIHWRVIQRYFGKLADESHPEIFEPHVQPEDLHWRKAEEVVYRIEPRLRFWKDLDYVALEAGGDTVTFNLMDMLVSYSQGKTYEERYLYHFREALWNEIFIRYLGEGTLEEQILAQLDNELIAPEKLNRVKAK